MGKALASFLHDRSGVTAIEYAVIAFFLCVVLVAATQSAGLHVATTLRYAAAFMMKAHPKLSP